MKFSIQIKYRPDRQQKDIRGKRSEACVATTEQANYGSSNNSSDFEHDACAFMTISRQSHALSVNLGKLSWFADSGATKHMTEHRDWFSTFNQSHQEPSQSQLPMIKIFGSKELVISILHGLLTTSKRRESYRRSYSYLNCIYIYSNIHKLVDV